MPPGISTARWWCTDFSPPPPNRGRLGWEVFSWTIKQPADGIVVAPDERLPWPQTVALGVQHVVAMFGATVLAPLLMGFDPNLAIFMSGIGTLLFFVLVGEIPLGQSLGVRSGSFPDAAATHKHLGLQDELVFPSFTLHVVDRVALLHIGVEAKNHSDSILNASEN